MHAPATSAQEDPAGSKRSTGEPTNRRCGLRKFGASATRGRDQAARVFSPGSVASLFLPSTKSAALMALAAATDAATSMTAR